METAVFTRWLLLLLFSPAVPDCVPSEFTMYVKRPECKFGVTITTKICTGLCETWEKNMIQDRDSQRYRSHSCTFGNAKIHTIRLPGCPSDINANYTYPEAVTCCCKNCEASSTECIELGVPNFYRLVPGSEQRNDLSLMNLF